MNNGWIKLHRKMVDWEWFQDPNAFRLFVYLLLTANHEERKWQGHVVRAGQKITSLQHLAAESRMSVRSIRTALTKLKTTGEVTYQTTSKYSLITINNWDKYQTIDTQADKRATSERHATDKQTTTNKNVKNDKNVRNTHGEFGNVLLSGEEFQKLKDRYGSPVNRLIEELSSYLQSSGKRYKDHYATLLNWAKRKNLEEVTRPTPKPVELPLTKEQIERNKELRENISKMLKRV